MGLKVKVILFNLVIIASLVVGLTSGFQFE